MADITRGGADGYPILLLNEASALTKESQNAEFTVELTGGDYKTVFVMTASAARTVKFAVGNGIQGAGDDLEISLEANTPSAIVLDSGYFKQVTGENKDCVVITPSGAVDFLIAELPQ